MENEMLEILKRLEIRFDSMETRIDKMDNRFNMIDDRLDKMDNRFNMIGDRLDKMDNRFDSIENKISNLEEGQKRIEKKLDGVHEQTADLTEFKTETKQGIEDIKNDIHTLKNVTRTNCYDIADLKAAN